MKKILLMTPDIEGPVRNGGIGTAFTSLAACLSGQGYEVDILYTCGEYLESSEKSFDDWSIFYKKQNINLLSTAVTKEINIDSPYFRKKSYSIYLWLKEKNHYDCVIACEWQADLYYSLLSKKNGTDFANTYFIVNAHSSTLWADEGSYQLPYDQNHLELYYMEKSVVEMADHVVSPSSYLLDWMKSKNWELPKNSEVILNCAPFQGFDKKSPVMKTTGQSTARNTIELVFFGRLETRKGLDIFLRALKNLKDEDIVNISAVTFLGKNVPYGSIDSHTHIKLNTEALDLPIKIITDYDRTNANEYIKRNDVLVITPSLVENSPYTVYECLINKVNFISSNVGGIPELIPAEFHDEILFSPTPNDLYGQIKSRIKKFKCAPGLVSSQGKIVNSWINVIENAEKTEFKKISEHHNPLVSICITHYDRAHLLHQAIASIKAQTYSNIEVILVDDGSKLPESKKYLDLLERDFSSRKWKIIRSSNNYLGAARNLASRHATGDYLLFMDDDNVAKPHEVEVFVTAALNSGADILTTPSDLIFGDEFPSPFRRTTHCWLPLGPDLNVAGFNNCFGDANALIKKDTFISLGGFTEDYGIGHEDWEFFSKAVLAGYKLNLVPEPLFWYRVAKTGMLISGNKSKNNYRSYRPFSNDSIRYNHAVGLIPSFIERINQLEAENDFLRSNNTNVFVEREHIEPSYSIGESLDNLHERVDALISQQRDGWANDRFNALNDKLSQINYLIHQKESLLCRRHLSKIRNFIKIKK
ncbi:glycosyltransferase [Erwinia piriflorinigrans]|uniref:Glycosyl transferase family 2 protein n=1 Tax=Erwinia piriflorinigrans CFBP 5888 TaxID=1161919 RepID=V5Z5Y8_9GAMM|nr:glycosyltransferase [Erwinia piriflorinigrans]CCG86688.1 Glycosyl transferase family 2 protein [Erwinia piriflorinigrans CFBP 5888]